MYNLTICSSWDISLIKIKTKISALIKTADKTVDCLLPVSRVLLWNLKFQKQGFA